MNKVSTAVELYFDVAASRILSEEQKQQVLQRLSNRISKEAILQVTSQTDRSQLANKQHAIRKFDELISKALVRRRKRIPTILSGHQKQKRRARKKKHGEKKIMRKKIRPGESF